MAVTNNFVARAVSFDCRAISGKRRRVSENPTTSRSQVWVSDYGAAVMFVVRN